MASDLSRDIQIAATILSRDKETDFEFTPKTTHEPVGWAQPTIHTSIQDDGQNILSWLKLVAQIANYSEMFHEMVGSRLPYSLMAPHLETD